MANRLAHARIAVLCLCFLAGSAVDFSATGSGSITGNLYDGTAAGINPNFTVNGSITSEGRNPANPPIDFAGAFNQARNPLHHSRRDCYHRGRWLRRQLQLHRLHRQRIRPERH
jgi:hypothetical protein